MICKSVDGDCRRSNIHHSNGVSKGVIDTHHIFPQSRFPEFRDLPWNKVRCRRDMHELYHRVFGNRTPWEVRVFVNRLNRLTNWSRSLGEALSYLDREYWRYFSDTRIDRIGACKRRWPKRLRKVPNYHLAHQVFRIKDPWEIAKYLEAYFSLVGSLKEKGVIQFLAKTFWGGFVPNLRPKRNGKVRRRRRYRNFGRFNSKRSV